MPSGIYITDPIKTDNVQHYGTLHYDAVNLTPDCHITTFSRSMKNGTWTEWYHNRNDAIYARAGSHIQLLINVTYDASSLLEISNLRFTYYNNLYQKIRLKAGDKTILSFSVATDGKYQKIRARSKTNKEVSSWIINDIVETDKDVYDKNSQLGLKISKKPDSGMRDIKKGLNKE